MIGIVMGQDCERTLALAIKSLKGCSQVYYMDGGSTDQSINIAIDNRAIIWNHPWDSNKKDMAGIQKKIMYDKAKKLHPGEWCAYIDADEMFEDGGIDRFINYPDKELNVYSVRMRHLIYNFAHEDDTKPDHSTHGRFFKLIDDVTIPHGNHVFFMDTKNNHYQTLNIVVWHFAYCGGMWDIKKRYDGQKSRTGGYVSHSLGFIKDWKNKHLFSEYPIRRIHPLDLPSDLLEDFDLSKDEIYFRHRMKLETKHFMMVREWKDYFKPESVLDCGCGCGQYSFVWNYLDTDVHGFDISEFAVENGVIKGSTQEDILNIKYNKTFDLVTAVDLLEHLKYDDLDIAINNIIKASKRYILVSIPFKGDKHLDDDKTHIIKEEKEWWIEQFMNKGLKIIPTPDHFAFKEQILIFEVEK